MAEANTHLEDGAGAGAAADETVGFLPVEVILLGELRLVFTWSRSRIPAARTVGFLPMEVNLRGWLRLVLT
jgi:hypothetical protein